MVEEDPGSSADKIHSEKYKITNRGLFYEIETKANYKDAILMGGRVLRYGSTINIPIEDNSPFSGPRLSNWKGREEEMANYLCNRCNLNNGSVEQATSEIKDFISIENYLVDNINKLISGNNGNGNGGNSSSKVKKTTQLTTT